MGLFDKVKAKMGVKDWLQGFECPRCGGRVYKTSYEKYSCESCGNYQEMLIIVLLEMT